jgi:hypothetical protein
MREPECLRKKFFVPIQGLHNQSESIKLLFGSDLHCP